MVSPFSLLSYANPPLAPECAASEYHHLFVGSVKFCASKKKKKKVLLSTCRQSDDRLHPIPLLQQVIKTASE